MRRVVVLAEAAEDLAEARRFYDAKEPGVGSYCVIAPHPSVACSSKSIRSHISLAFQEQRELRV